jgi:hypothetical protein
MKALVQTGMVRGSDIIGEPSQKAQAQAPKASFFLNNLLNEVCLPFLSLSLSPHSQATDQNGASK